MYQVIDNFVNMREYVPHKGFRTAAEIYDYE